MILDQPTTTLVAPDGSPLRALPTTILSADDAKLIRTYFLSLLRAQLEPEYYCRRCKTGHRDQHVQFQIDDDQIVFVCACRTLFHQGRAETPPRPIHIPAGYRTRDEVGGWVVTKLPLSAQAAALLRTWKPLLRRLDLIEALRCNVCWERELHDGLEAIVTDRLIKLRCRCTLRFAAAAV